MAHEVNTYRTYVEDHGSAVAIVAIVVVLLIAVALAVLYWDSIVAWSGTGPNVVINEPAQEVVRENTIRETNTIIQPQSSPTTSSGSGATGTGSGTGGGALGTTTTTTTTP